MVSNQSLKACLSAGLPALFLVLAGCRMLGADEADAVPSRSATTSSQQAAEPEPFEDLTATEAAIAAEGAAASAEAAPPPESSPVLNPNAPKTYTVQRGDTLWDIASMFLRDPWLWPEIWIVNEQVQNPHLIYPGDVLALAYGADGRPQVRLERGGPARLNPRLRSSPLEGAIPTLPYQAIAAFLSRPSLLSAEDVKRAPHVVAFRDRHMIGGAGHDVYVQNLDAEANARYSVVHVGAPLRDPDDGDVLGYEGTYTATATVTQPGNPAKLLLSDSERETLQGDKLFSTDLDAPLNFTLKAPATDINGRIIHVVDGTHLIGQFQIVAINRGERHGVEPGNVLAVDQAGEVIRDHYGRRGLGAMKLGKAFSPKVKLPDERAGTLLVFKTYDRMSYALVVGASNEIRVADVVRNP